MSVRVSLSSDVENMTVESMLPSVYFRFSLTLAWSLDLSL